MDFPSFPSERQIADSWRRVRAWVWRYGRTLIAAVGSPTALIRGWLKRRPSSRASRYLSPVPFALYTLFFTSLLIAPLRNAMALDESLLPDYTLRAHLLAFGRTAGALQHYAPRLDVLMLLGAAKFALVLLVVACWTRLVYRGDRSFWRDFASLAYLLPIALGGQVLELVGVNLLFHTVGPSMLVVTLSSIPIVVVTTGTVYLTVLVVVGRLYCGPGWRRAFHAIGFALGVPITLFLFNALLMAPEIWSAYRVRSALDKGRRLLLAGDYQAAEPALTQSIALDPTGYWSGQAHLLLVSVHSRRILAQLPDIASDSAFRVRMHASLVGESPTYRRLMELWGMHVAPSTLVEIRERLLEENADGDVPVTNNELDAALSQSHGPNGDPMRLPAPPSELKPAENRQWLFYQLYRQKALDGEPGPTNSTRYLQFLAGLTFRLEFLSAHYRARNIMREAEALASLDDRDRFYQTDRDGLISGNREFRDKGLKYPHLLVPDATLQALSTRAVAFRFRQVYLDYLQAEARSLASSRICSQSAMVAREVEAIQTQLAWTAKDIMYIDVPAHPDPYGEQLLRRLFPDLEESPF